MRQFEAVAAVAGAGKTYQLTTRYLALLAQGVSPESILAITFTRKAAGEIFDRIVSRLARAILNAEERKQLEADLRKLLGTPQWSLDEEVARDWLWKVIQSMPRLRIGTIDSLFVSMAQAFAFELGLPAGLEIIDGSILALTQAETLDETLAAAQADEQTASELEDSFMQITERDPKRIREALLDLVREAHALFLENPDENRWGKLNTIWTRPSWWAAPPSKDCTQEKNALWSAVASEPDNQYVEAWSKVITALQEGNWSLNIALMKCLLDHWLEQPEELEFSYRSKKYHISGDVWPRLHAIAAKAMQESVERLTSRARAAYHLARLYEQTYEQRVRNAGQLSFSDVQHVLRRAAEKGVKLDIDYRLDGKFDHWMIDEFQDTSRAQWDIIGNLVDEILQSDSDDRSFVYVGDAKQAIYGWRGGDSTLFSEVYQAYANRFENEPTILNTSWRSSPVILNAVNKLFDPNQLTLLEQPFETEIKRWQELWSPHKPAAKNRNLPGYVEVRMPVSPSSNATSSSDSEGVINETRTIVKQLRENGVTSIAVLVRLNSFGDTVADALRAEGIPVLREVNPTLLDNGMISALLSLCRFADHPGDRFSFKHVQMAGLLPVLQKLFNLPPSDWEVPASRDKLAARLRATASTQGIAGLLKDVIRAYFSETGGWATDEFIETRLRQLLLVATDFDRLYQKGLSHFADHAADIEVKDPIVTSGVVVITVHKAKGLEFDAVVLPDLAGRNREMTHLETGKLAQFDISREKAEEIGTTPNWILPIPDKSLTALDPVLRHFRKQAAQQRFYEELCLLYVAATRARQGLYFVIPEPKNSKGNRTADKDPCPADLVRKVFCPASVNGKGACAISDVSKVQYAVGQPDWFRITQKPTPAAELKEVSPFQPVCAARAETRKRLLAGTPSGTEEVREFSAAQLFDPARRRGAQRGAIVHELFRHIEWYWPDAVEKAIEDCRTALAGIEPDIWDEALADFYRAVRSKDIQELLKCPSPRAEVWNEQAFELAEDDRWITGRMDRVVVERDANGRIISALVVDFKTDRIGSDDELARHVELYRQQMKWYAKAISCLVGLPARAVRTYLLFIHVAKVVEVIADT